MIWTYILAAVIAYAIGNLNFSIIFSRIFFNKDIRNYGSGNAGTTNTFRTFGPVMGTIVLLCDFGKGALAVYLAKFVLFSPPNSLAAVIAALFVGIGHVYPVIFRFHGGKGVAAIGGALLMLDYRMLCIMLPVFIAILLITGYMSAASLSVVITFPLSAFIISHFIDSNLKMYTSIYVIVASIFGLFILFTHRSNVSRLIKGEEKKLLWNKKKKNKEDGSDG